MIWNDIAFPVKEVWKNVDIGNAYYQVSNYGRVRSLDRLLTFERNGTTCNRLFKGKILKPKTDKDGYLEVCLSLGEGNRVYRRVHRLVGKAFVIGYEEGLVIDHIIPEKDFNHYYNLQWCTNTENTIKYYSEESGLGRPLSSLSKFDWLYIGFLYNEGLEYKVICENLGITVKSVDTLWEGLSGRRLSSVTGFQKGDFTKRKHPTTKLNLEDVVGIIKARLIDKQSLKELSNKYGIAESMISRFCKGKRQPEALKLFKERYNLEL